MLAFWRVVEAHVKAYVNVYYVDDAAVLADGELARFWDTLATANADIRTGRYNGDEAGHLGALRGKADLIEKLSFFIWQVTGYHNHVGNVADYLLGADFAGAKIRKGEDQSDVQASFQGLMIALMTAMKVRCLHGIIGSMRAIIFVVTSTFFSLAPSGGLFNRSARKCCVS